MNEYKETGYYIELSMSGFDWEERNTVDTLLKTLVSVLSQLAGLEKEYREKLNRTAGCHDTLLAEYRTKYYNILAPVCTYELINRPYRMRCSSPAAYEYINTGCHFYFTKKADNKVTADIHFNRGIVWKHRFEFTYKDVQWRISRAMCAREGSRWHTLLL